MQKLILSQHQSPGDIVMLTCAIRDLHLSYPGEYQTDVRTSCNSIFDHNPYITKLNHRSRDVRTIPMHYHGRINDCNSRPGHFCEAFTAYLSAELKRPIRKHCIRGDIYVSEFERKNNPIGGKYWLVLDGGKSDYTTKHYSHERIQEVVNYFQGKIQFVQVGQSGRRGSLTHFNRPLENVINYLDKTDIRQWIHLTHHAEGVLCGVTGQMHLAAAVPTPEGKPKNRAAVIFGGGREPVQWYQYPFHQVLHTNGLLPCCENGGCWRNRTVPLNDGDDKDKSLCAIPILQPNGKMLQKCMDLIESCDVIRAIELYYASGSLKYL